MPLPRRSGTIPPVKLVALLLGLMTVLPPTGSDRFEAADDISVLVKVEGRLEQAALPGTTTGESRGWKQLRVPRQGSAEETIKHLSERLGTLVSLDRRYGLLGPESEPLFGDQWGLENTGQSGGTADADIDATRAWSVTTGAGPVVAVIDSGIETANSQLDGRLWSNSAEIPGDGIDNDGNGFRDDVNGWDFEDNDNDPRPVGSSSDDGHGTMVAGVLAAEVDGAGTTGIAPSVTIMNLRACDNGFCTTFAASDAIFYAVDMGADVINLSFGSPVPSQLGDPMLEEALDHALARGVLVVTAAGNTRPDELGAGEVILPAEFPHPNNIAVAASDRNDRLAGFSYYGPNVDIAAPGDEIRTTGLGGSYPMVSGTSFAAPLVSGTAALLLSKKPTMSYQELAERIKGFADKPAAIGSRVEAGRLNAGRSLTEPFVDAFGHLFENDIKWAADQGITKGCNPPMNTRFCPNDPVSREVMAAFLNRYLNLPPPSRDYFSDDANSIFEDDINRLAEAGITKGCGGTRFCPGSTVDRGQMAAFLVRAFGLTDNGGGDLFIDDDTSIFEGDIDRLGTAGITKGCNPPVNDMFCPDRAVDRGAMAAFLHRAPAP